jgi:hypothetical protein
MAHLRILILLAALTRSLLTHATAELVQTGLRLFAPSIPSMACIIIGVVLAVIVVEIAIVYWDAYIRSDDNP